MADVFTPPPLSAHEGPAQGFTPPPLSSHEGPAPQSGFLGEYWQKVNPVTAAQGVVDIARHPIEAGKSYGQQNIDLWNRAMDAFHTGDYGGGAAHLLHYFANGVPGVGAALDEAGNKFRAGDFEGGAADTAALATQIYGPKAVMHGVNIATEPEFVAGTKGAIKGGAKGAVDLVPYGHTRLPIPASLAGAAAGKYVAGEPGAVIGASIPIIRGARRGWTEAVEAYRAPAPAAAAPEAAAEIIGPSAELRDQVARGMTGKPYDNLNAAERATVDRWAEDVHRADQAKAQPQAAAPPAAAPPAATPRGPINLDLDQYAPPAAMPRPGARSMPNAPASINPEALAPTAPGVSLPTRPAIGPRPLIGPEAPAGPAAPEVAPAVSYTSKPTLRGISVTAFDPGTGEVLGSAEFEGPKPGQRRPVLNAGAVLTPGQLAPRSVDVAPAMRRQGIATAMYDQAAAEWQKVTGKPTEILRSPAQSEAGGAFRDAYDARNAPPAAAAAEPAGQQPAPAADDLSAQLQASLDLARGKQPAAAQEPAGAAPEAPKENPYQAAARTRKARAMATWAYNNGYTADDLAKLGSEPNEDWAYMAEQARTNAPNSPDTIAQVINELRGMHAQPDVLPQVRAEMSKRLTRRQMQEQAQPEPAAPEHHPGVIETESDALRPRAWNSNPAQPVPIVGNEPAAPAGEGMLSAGQNMSSSGKLGLHLIEHVPGRWGYVGSVPKDLAWEHLDGTAITDEELGKLRSFGPGLYKNIRGRTWPTREAAEAAAQEPAADPARAPAEAAAQDPAAPRAVSPQFKSGDVVEWSINGQTRRGRILGDAPAELGFGGKYSIEMEGAQDARSRYRNVDPSVLRRVSPAGESTPEPTAPKVIPRWFGPTLTKLQEIDAHAKGLFQKHYDAYAQMYTGTPEDAARIAKYHVEGFYRDSDALTRAQSDLERFRQLARERGFDPESVLQQAGVPDWARAGKRPASQFETPARVSPAGESTPEPIQEQHERSSEIDPPNVGSRDAGEPGAGEIRDAAARPALPRPAGASPRAGQGSETSVIVPAGENQYEIPARYIVRELDEIQPSHHGATFQPNPKYGLKNDRDYNNPVNQAKVINGSGEKFNPRQLITDNPDATNGPPVIDAQGNIVGGNGRGMILQRVHQLNPAGAAAYRQMLTDRAAQYGLDPAEVARMKQPVLLREISDDNVNAQRAVTDLNKTGTAALTPAEQAIADSRGVSTATLEDLGARLDAKGPDATLAQVLEGRDGRIVLEKLIKDGVIGSQERAAYADRTGALTPAGKTRISKLVLGRFFSDPEQLDSLAPSIRNKVERIAAPLAKVEALGHEWSLTPKMQEAIDLVQEARAHGTGNLDDVLQQQGLFGGGGQYSPEAVTLARHLLNGKAAELTRIFRQYAADAAHAAEGPDMFGNQAASAADSFRAAFAPR